jgi:hypothetical protein
MGKPIFEVRDKILFFPTGWIPDWAVCAGLDGIDLLHAPISMILTPASGAGVALDAIVDIIQVATAFAFFANPVDALPGAVEVVLPPGFDVFPTYSSWYIYRRFGTANTSAVTRALFAKSAYRARRKK